MPKLYKPPFTLEEDLARFQGLLPPPAMVEQFGDLLHRAHKSDVGPHERSHWLGVCDDYIMGLKAANLLSAAQVPDLREIVQWATQRSTLE